MIITPETIESIKKKLRSMPKIEKIEKNICKQDMVTMLKREIESMQRRGYTLKQIADAISGVGVAITTPTLKSYLQRSKPLSSFETSSSVPALTSAVLE